MSYYVAGCRFDALPPTIYFFFFFAFRYAIYYYFDAMLLPLC